MAISGRHWIYAWPVPLLDRFIGIVHEIVRPVLVWVGLWSINYPCIGYSGTQAQVVVLSSLDQSSTFPVRSPLASISLESFGGNCDAVNP